MDSGEVEYYDIVIVGGGIGGLATALALHRKGFTSIVLEKGDTLRATGAALAVLANGWRALDQLAVGSQLRNTALPIERSRDIVMDKDKEREMPFLTGEARGVKRSELMNTMADALPHGTIHFGCQVVSIKLDSQTMISTLQLYDGKSIHAKIVIGCDGSKSIVADFLELNPPRKFGLSGIRGFTNYPEGHTFSQEFVRIRRGKILTGRVPINNNLVFWFVVQQSAQSDAVFLHDPEMIKQTSIDSVHGFPIDVQELIQRSDLDSLSFTHLRYRAPWEFLFRRQFRKGTITIVGDAMHVMGPFLGQGGSSAIEDAVVLARNLSKKINAADLCNQDGKQIMTNKVESALDQYVEERRMRVVRLSTQAYLFGVLLDDSASVVKKFISNILMAALFKDPTGHTKYDCGSL